MGGAVSRSNTRYAGGENDTSSCAVDAEWWFINEGWGVPQTLSKRPHSKRQGDSE